MTNCRRLATSRDAVVTIDALRYYDDAGLLAPAAPERDRGQDQQYCEHHK